MVVTPVASSISSQGPASRIILRVNATETRLFAHPTGFVADAAIHLSWNRHKVVPPIDSVQLVNITPISLGLIYGRYIELVNGIINQQA